MAFLEQLRFEAERLQEAVTSLPDPADGGDWRGTVDGESLAESPGWLVCGAARWFVHEVEEALRRHELGWRDYSVLAVLEPGEPLSQQSIGQRLGIDRSSMTYLIDGLERRGLVVRGRDRTDRRAYSIELSDSGRLLISEVLRPITADIHDGFAGKLTREDRSRLAHLLAMLPQGD